VLIDPTTFSTGADRRGRSIATTTIHREGRGGASRPTDLLWWARNTKPH